MDIARVSFSGVRHETHMVYVSSWARRFAEVSGSAVEFVDLDGDGTPRRQDLLRPLLPEGMLLVPLEDVELRFERSVAIGAPSIRRWLRRPVRAGTVVVDEGLGSHSSLRTRRSALRREGTGDPQASLTAVARWGARQLMASERWHIYRLERGRWVVNQFVADEFARHRPAVERGDHVVYLSQPWVELGLVDAATQLRHLERIESAVESAGRRLVVCPHPWEAAGRYAGFDVTAEPGPAELDPVVIGAAMVIGDTSTALLNLAAMFGVASCRVAPTVAPPLSAAQRSLFDTFTGPVTAIDELAGRIGR